MSKFKLKLIPLLSKLWKKFWGNLEEILQNFDKILNLEKFKEGSKHLKEILFKLSKIFRNFKKKWKKI